MELVNLSKSEMIDLLGRNDSSDHYRKIICDFSEDCALGFYYKEFIDLKESEFANIDDVINFKKHIRNGNEFTWEHYLLLPKIAVTNRLEEVSELSRLGQSPIKGLALYRGYPVGVLMPRLLVHCYKSLNELDDLSKQEKERVFEKAARWIEELITREAYPVNIYGGNIVVDPEHDFDVVLDGLEEPGVVRVESKRYVESLKNRPHGRDLEKEALGNFETIKGLYLK